MKFKKHIKCTAHHHPPLFKDHHSTVLSPRFLPGPDFFGIMQSSNIRNLCPMYRTTHLTPIQQNHTALHLLRFKPLLHYNCSVHSRPFVCSSYVPFCYPSHPEFYVPPCRSFRLSAKSACLHCRQPALANSFKLLSPPQSSAPLFWNFAIAIAIAVHSTITAINSPGVLCLEQNIVFFFLWQSQNPQIIPFSFGTNFIRKLVICESIFNVLVVSFWVNYFPFPTNVFISQFQFWMWLLNFI